MPASPEQVDQLSTFAALLRKWNRTFNLVSRQDIGRLVARHILDSVAPLKLLDGPRVMDLGSGAGLPGLPLAILAPDLHFTLWDRSDRRMRFCHQVVVELALDNVVLEVAHMEAASKPDQPFNTVLARGVATAPVVWDMVQHTLAPDGCVLVYASTQTAEEDAAEEQTRQQDEIEISQHEFHIPNLPQPHTVLRLVRS